jgi:antitoxin component YwqK of YwqJK toxin-antitoxin module
MTNNVRVQFDDLTVDDDQSLSYQGKPFTGIAYETNSAGIVVSEAGYDSGLQAGVTREWDHSGHLLSESYFAQGSKHGTSKQWHNNGHLESESEYSCSIKTRERVWDTQGRLLKDWALPENDEQRALIKLLEKRFGH